MEPGNSREKVRVDPSHTSGSRESASRRYSSDAEDLIPRRPRTAIHESYVTRPRESLPDYPYSSSSIEPSLHFLSHAPPSMVRNPTYSSLPPSPIGGDLGHEIQDYLGLKESGSLPLPRTSYFPDGHSLAKALSQASLRSPTSFRGSEASMSNSRGPPRTARAVSMPVEQNFDAVNSSSRSDTSQPESTNDGHNAAQKAESNPVEQEVDTHVSFWTMLREELVAEEQETFDIDGKW